MLGKRFATSSGNGNSGQSGGGDEETVLANFWKSVFGEAIKDNFEYLFARPLKISKKILLHLCHCSLDL